MLARLRSRARQAVLVAAVGAVAAGCASPGTPAPAAEAAKLGVGTNDIASACGYAEELTAFADRHVDLSRLEAAAEQGARKLAQVYSHSHTWIYQGQSIGAVVNNSISLLGRCGLPAAQKALLRVMHR